MRGKVGTSKFCVWPITIGLNNKGGRDEDEFKKYMEHSIFPLYPDATDENGKHVFIKIDSGLGRKNLNMLACYHNLGFIFYPGVPNTTHVTQETDQVYGLFKSIFCENLDKLTKFKTKYKMSVSLQQWIVVLVVFGGLD